ESIEKGATGALIGTPIALESNALRALRGVKPGVSIAMGSCVVSTDAVSNVWVLLRASDSVRGSVLHPNFVSAFFRLSSTYTLHSMLRIVRARPGLMLNTRLILVGIYLQNTCGSFAP